MAKRKTPSELLQEKKKAREVLEKKINHLKEEERRLKAKVKQENDKLEKKNRMKVICRLYAMLGRNYAEGDEERLAAFFAGQEARGFWFSKAMNEGLDLPSPKESNASTSQTPDPDTSVPSN